MSRASLLADPAGRYIDAGVIQISVTNAVIIGLMVVVFVLAILLPFPGRRHHDQTDHDGTDRDRTDRDR